jgi:HTH-type transcriptional regulator/antitoxin HigA
MDIRPIKTEAEYDRALAEIEGYFDAEPELGTPESQRFDVLASLIEHYESRAWPIDLPDPVEAIRTQADLARVLGSRPRASEVLDRRRALTKEQAFKLHRAWHIPAQGFRIKRRACGRGYWRERARPALHPAWYGAWNSCP